MKPIADVVNAISGVINGVTLPAREKKELQAEILRLVYEREREMIEARAGVIRAEAAGNWLQRSWRPLVMLIFAVIVLIGSFTSLPMLADTSRFWDLLEIGLAGTWWERGKNHAGIRTKATLILDLVIVDPID